MRRHSLICRLGPQDRAPVPVAEPDSRQTTLQFIPADRRLGYGVGDTVTALQRLGLQPTETAVDLLLLAATVYGADTRIARESEAQDSWSREVDVYLPVLEPERWEGLGGRLAHALEFLSGDKWRFRFRPRPRGARQLVRRTLVRPRGLPRAVCLFSGGLDSFIGAVDLLEAGQDPLLVSHGRVGSASAHQGLCEKALQQHYGRGRVRRINSRIGFPQGAVAETAPENTERSRSFLFFSLAALAASALPTDATTVYVPENGLITLNVPLDPLRLGSLSTRTTHPYFIARFNELLVDLGIPAVLQNPYRHQTKGEMVRGCRNQTLLGANLINTMSCSSPDKGRWQKLTPGHCGYCLPCLIRKASLLDWPSGDPTRYLATDMHCRILDSLEAEGDNVRSLQLALARLGGSMSRARVLIHKPGPLTDAPAEIPDFARVYLAGMQEVARVIAPLLTRPDPT